MVKYILKRLLVSLIILWAVLSATFILIHLAPGDPSMLYIRPDIDKGVVENIRSQMGFDQPVLQQYIIWAKNFISGNFGYSFTQHRPVAEILLESIPNTLRLTLTVLFLQFIVGIGLGIYCARNESTKVDEFINSTLLFLHSMPGFWIALIAILFFSIHLGWLPSSQMNSIGSFASPFDYLWDSIRHLILPAGILSIPFISYTTRVVRDKFVAVQKEPFMFSAQAYGLSKRKIVYKYAMKNTLLPLVTLVGLYLPFLLGGAVITEYIFSWPGMGRITINAIFSYDYPLILACNFVATAAVIGGNMLSDVLYFWVDPRIRFSEKQG